MKKVIAALSLCGCLLPGLALGDELDDATDQLMRDSSMKCTDEANAMLANRIRAVLPDMLLSGLRDSRKLGVAWGPGNENYRQTRDVLEAAMLDEEAKNGPLVALGVRAMLRAMIASWTPAQRAEYSAFSTQKSGRVYWGKMADKIMCPAAISALGKPPYQLPPGAQRDRLQALELGLKDAELSMDVGVLLLSNDQHARLDKLMPELTDSMLKAYGVLIDAYPRRAELAAKPVVPALMKVVMAYKP